MAQQSDDENDVELETDLEDSETEVLDNDSSNSINIVETREIGMLTELQRMLRDIPKEQKGYQRMVEVSRNNILCKRNKS